MKTPERPISKPSGFTLVELLVVIAIIGSLASIAFFVGVRAKNSALSAATLTNLRDIGVAAELWKGEHQGYFIPAWDKSTNSSYAQTLDPYIHGVESFRNVKSKFIGPDKRLEVKVNANSHPITYSLNMGVCRDITPKGDYTAKLIHSSQVDRLNEVILLADGCQNPGNLNQANSAAYRIFYQIGETGPVGQFSQPIPVGPDTDTNAGDGWFRYPYGKCHALMCDGSARTFPKGTIQKRNLWIDTVRN